MQYVFLQSGTGILQPVNRVERQLVLIGRDHLQVHDHPQEFLRLRTGRLNAFDSVPDHVERGSQVVSILVFLQGQRPLRLQGLQLLHRRLRGIGPIQQLPPGGGAFGGEGVPVRLLLPHFHGTGGTSQ